MVKPKVGLPELNNLLIQRLHDVIGTTDDAEALLNLTEAVAKLNSSFRNNSRVGEDEISPEEVLAQEEHSAFASCAEGEVLDGNQP